MPHIPAICPNHHIFPSGIYIEDSTNITLENNIIICPICRKPAKVIEGVFDFIDNTITILKAPKISIEILKKFYTIIIDAKDEKKSREKILKEVQEKTPELNSIKDVLPKNRVELYSVLAILIQILTLILGGSANPSSTVIINNVYINQSQKSERTNGDSSFIDVNFPRNKPCPCNSGKQFKRCHGKHT